MSVGKLSLKTTIEHASWEFFHLCRAAGFLFDQGTERSGFAVCSVGAAAGEDERGAQQASVRHSGQTAVRVQREAAAPPEGKDVRLGGQGRRATETDGGVAHATPSQLSTSASLSVSL